MKFIITRTNHNAETIGYYTESTNQYADMLIGSITQDKDAAKVFDSRQSANNARIYLSEKLDMNLTVDYLHDKDDILSNRDDYNELIRLLNKYEPEDIAQAIVCHTDRTQRTRLLNEIYLLDSNQQTVV